MFKVLKVIKKSAFFQELISDLDIGPSFVRVLSITLFTLFVVHLGACIWFLIANISSNPYETWIGDRNIIDSSHGFQYLNSMYWAFQIVTTIGYGDIAIHTSTEYIYTIIWMIFGVTFYSFVLGVVILIYIKYDKDEMILKDKLKVVEQFSVKHSLPPEVQKKIRLYFQN